VSIELAGHGEGDFIAADFAAFNGCVGRLATAAGSAESASHFVAFDFQLEGGFAGFAATTAAAAAALHGPGPGAIGVGLFVRSISLAQGAERKNGANAEQGGHSSVLPYHNVVRLVLVCFVFPVRTLSADLGTANPVLRLQRSKAVTATLKSRLGRAGLRSVR